MIPMMSLYTTDLIKHISEMNTVKRDYHYLPEILSKFTLSQIVYVAFGSNIDLDWMHRRQLKLGELFLPHMRNLTLFGPLIQYIPFTSSWELLKTRREVESYMGHVIDLVQKDLDKPDSDESSTNLIKTLLKEYGPRYVQPPPNNPPHDCFSCSGRVTKQEIVSEASTFLFAGFDTTAVTLGFCLAYLATNPRWISWLQEEIDQILGAGDHAKEPSADDLSKLKRTRAVINESLRLRPPAPQLSRTPRDVKLGEYEIPAGTNIQSSIFMVQRNPKLWKNPNVFDPSRWVEKDENQMQHPYAFIPFSAGLRNCIGKNFAIQEAIIGLSMIMSKFNVELDPARPMKVQGTPVAMPFAWIKFIERDN
jgi:cytochrome P450